MPRIRTLKPEFWTDEKLALLDPLDRLVFLGLISMADDYGRLIDNVKMLDGQLFPFTDDSVEPSLATLAQLSRILRYTSTSGQNLIQIVGWKNHQKVDHPGKEILPAPSKEDWLQPVTGQRPIAPPRKPRGPSSRKSRETVAQLSRSDLGPTTNDLGPSTPSDSGESVARKSWPASAAELWSEKVTPISPARCGGTLKTVVDRFGWEATRAGIERYIVGTPDNRTRDLAGFAKEANRWVRYGTMKTNDANGDLTEWGVYLDSVSRRKAS